MMITENLELFRELFKEAPYSSEEALINTVLANLDRFLFSHDPFVGSQEVEIGSGKVDIIVGAADLKNLLARISNQNLVDYDLRGTDAVVLSHLYLNRSLRPESIAKRANLEVDVVKKSLSRLVDLGFCLQVTCNTYSRAQITEHITHLIAIEGKLQHWKKALIQAYRNRLFSTISYVVMDAHYARPAIDQIHEFESRNIGLAVAISNTQSVEIIFRPIAERPISNLFALLAKEAITSRIRDNYAIVSEEIQHAISG